MHQTRKRLLNKFSLIGRNIDCISFSGEGGGGEVMSQVDLMTKSYVHNNNIKIALLKYN